jgi:hypothetical protein
MFSATAVNRLAIYRANVNRVELRSALRDGYALSDTIITSLSQCNMGRCCWHLACSQA